MPPAGRAAPCPPEGVTPPGPPHRRRWAVVAAVTGRVDVRSAKMRGRNGPFRCRRCAPGSKGAIAASPSRRPFGPRSWIFCFESLWKGFFFKYGTSPLALRRAVAGRLLFFTCGASPLAPVVAQWGLPCWPALRPVSAAPIARPQRPTPRRPPFPTALPPAPSRGSGGHHAPRRGLGQRPSLRLPLSAFRLLLSPSTLCRSLANLPVPVPRSGAAYPW